MRLNLQTDYALRLLMHLAVNEGHVGTIAEVAARYGISKNHLMKVANVLGKEGVIETLRGRTGGLRLARSAKDIVVGDIVRRMEADFALVECFRGGKGGCVIAPACRLKGMLAEALDAFLMVLDRYTLHQLAGGNDELALLLAKRAA